MPRVQILNRFTPGMVDQANIMVRQVNKAAAGGAEFDLFEKITRAALVHSVGGPCPSALGVETDVC